MTTDPAGKHAAASPDPVLQVERRDYPQLAPTGRARVQPMRGFDEIYTDIVDYIVRCTHKIWDERDIGLIYSHYTHNCVLYGTLGTLYTREAVVQDTIQRLVSFPERRGMATQVIWRGDEDAGFYTSHLVTGTGRHTQHGHLGAPTGRTFTSRTIADCMVHENKIYREWVVAETLTILQQLGLDAGAHADRMAAALHAKGVVNLDIGENRRLLGQYPPETAPDLTLAHDDTEAMVLGWMHDIWNRRMFGTIARVYAQTCLYHGPLLTETYGQAAVIHQSLGLLGSIPDAAWMPQHVCSTPCEEGGVKVAIRWVMEGHHLGHGILLALGAPTGHRVQLTGISHYHVKDGLICDEWRVYDELQPMVQVRLSALAS